jgi:sugar fermentation stimulation protein A
MGCSEPGFPVWLSDSGRPKRRCPMTWEMVEVEGGVLVGVNTALSNRLVVEAIESGALGDLADYDKLRREVSFGPRGSRIDLLLQAGGSRCYVEVKNVTAAVSWVPGVGLFPDAVTARGTRHLRELMTAVDLGHRAMLCFCVQRGDVQEVRPADRIDPDYGRTLREAVGQGVEVIAYGADVSPRGITLTRKLAVEL